MCRSVLLVCVWGGVHVQCVKSPYAVSGLACGHCIARVLVVCVCVQSDEVCCGGVACNLHDASTQTTLSTTHTHIHAHAPAHTYTCTHLLSSPCLCHCHCQALGIDDVANFDFMDPPPRAAIIRWVLCRAVCFDRLANTAEIHIFFAVNAWNLYQRQTHSNMQCSRGQCNASK